MTPEQAERIIALLERIAYELAAQRRKKAVQFIDYGW